MAKFTLMASLLLALLPLEGTRADAYSDETIRYVNKEDGLSGGTVSNIMADGNGRVWIATNNGICRFNGQKFTTFDIPGSDKARNYTYDLTLHDGKTVYAATGDGVFQLRDDGKFTNVLPTIKHAETILSEGNTLFIGNRDGLHVYDGHRVKTITVGSTPLGIENGVRDIRKGNDGGLWFISRYSLNRYDLKTGKVNSVHISAKLPARSALSHLAIGKNTFFIGTKNNGLYIFHPKTGQLTSVKGVGNVITSIYNAPDGNMTVSCDGTGAFLINGSTGEVIERFNARGDRKHRLPTNAVYCYRRDKNGVDWFGFYRYGMAYAYHSEDLFRTYGLGDFSTEGLDVRSALINGKQKVIGTTDGLYNADEQSGKIRHFSPEELGGMHIISTLAYFHGAYYIGSYDAGLRRIDTRTYHVEEIPGQPLLTNTTIGAMAINEREHRLWIGTSEGVCTIGADNHVSWYTEYNSRIVSSTITGLCFRPDGGGWISGAGGLCLYTSSTGLFEKGNFPNGFFNKENIKEIRTGHGGMYFFNAMSAIYYSDWTLRHFGQLRLPTYLASATKISFLDDKRGNYWIVTDEGLFCHDYRHEYSLHFGYGEGLQCQLIFAKPYFDGKNTIWIGTSNGLMYVNLDDLAQWRKHPKHKISLYDVSVNGNLPTYKDEERMNNQKALTLSWNFASERLALKPNLNDYSRPYNRLYEYRLDNQEGWTVVKSGEDIALGNLFLGSHTLQVRLAGVADTTSAYHITVTPSPGAMLEAVALLLAAGGMVFLHKRRRESILAAREEAMRREAEDNLDLYDQGKSRKYERVKLDEKECARVVKRMKLYIEKNKLYTNPDLKMSEVAEYLNLSASKLSQIFNLYMKENYYDFINRYRLEEFKKLLSSGGNKRYTLTALSEKCGFRKSSFFSAFRKFEGMTPTEYIEKNHIKLS